MNHASSRGCKLDGAMLDATAGTWLVAGGVMSAFSSLAAFSFKQLTEAAKEREGAGV
jgi:hypothetical protein